jgi:hypothetical protein
LKEAAGGVFAIPKGATTMQIEMRDTAASVGATTAGFRLPTFGLRWGAVFAGLAVGIATNIVLLLVGVAAGLAAIEVADGAGEGTVTIAAGIWHTLSMMAAALAGGYVAARASGLRRTADGMLHGAVAWGVACWRESPAARSAHAVRAAWCMAWNNGWRATPKSR